MAQVVKRLLDIVQPHRLYLGQKDFQQIAVIRTMIRHFHLPVEIVEVPTVREPSGLAMSSRNQRLFMYPYPMLFSAHKPCSTSPTFAWNTSSSVMH